MDMWVASSWGPLWTKLPGTFAYVSVGAHTSALLLGVKRPRHKTRVFAGVDTACFPKEWNQFTLFRQDLRDSIVHVQPSLWFSLNGNLIVPHPNNHMQLLIVFVLWEHLLANWYELVHTLVTYTDIFVQSRWMQTLPPTTKMSSDFQIRLMF